MLLISFLIVICSSGETSNNKVNPTTSTVKLASIDTLQIISRINKKVESIDNKELSYRKVEKDLHGQSAEGGVLIAYYDGTALRKIKTTFYGEIGKSTFDYYLDEERFFYIKKECIHYDRPMYIEDYKVTSVKESKYYFDNGDLWLWKDFKGEYVNPQSNEFKEERNCLLKAIEEFKSLLGDYQPID